MKKSIYKYLLLLGVLVVSLLSLLGCGKELSQSNANAAKIEVSQSLQAPTGTMKVHVLDIGQGDAILLQIGDRFSMIDTGDIEKIWSKRTRKCDIDTSSCRSYWWFLCHR